MQSLISSQVPTMSSREIAELVEKRHDNVKRTIETLVGRGVISRPQIEDGPKSANGVTVQEYRIGKRDSHVIVAQLSPEFTARLVDRWQELETGAAPQFIVPQTKAGALRLAADLAEQVEQQQVIIDAMKPKADFHDAVAEAVNCQDMQAVAKVLGTGRTRLFRFLRGRKVLQDNNRPYQRYEDAGYFKVTERTWRGPDGETHTDTTTLVTGKGLAYIQKLLAPAAPNSEVA